MTSPDNTANGPGRVWPPRTSLDHFLNAVAWLHDGYGGRLSEEECRSIVRVLWARAEQSSST